jgi:hypothetical protein
MIWRIPEFTFYNMLAQSHYVQLLAGIEKSVKYLRKKCSIWRVQNPELLEKRRRQLLQPNVRHLF